MIKKKFKYLDKDIICKVLKINKFMHKEISKNIVYSFLYRKKLTD